MKIICLQLLGFISLGIAIVGIFLPLLPTTPLLLLSLFFFSRSSKKLEQRIKTNRWLKNYLEPYLYGVAIPRVVKLRTIALLWTALLLSWLMLKLDIKIGILLLLVGIGVSVHIVKLNRK